MELQTINWILEQSGLAAVAIMALSAMWFQHKDSMRRERENAETHRHDKGRITEVLQDVAKSNAELCTLIRELREDLRIRRD